MHVRFSILILLTIIVVGCQQENKDHTLPAENQDQSIVHVKDSNMEDNKSYENKDIASHLANVASDVPNVYDAVAIVAGPYAVVGIDVDGELDRSRVGTIKYTVSEALQHDPYGKTAVVIADADIMERIRSMGQSIQDGYPIRGVIDELSAIVGRYMPDFPVDEDRQKPDQNKEIVPDEEKEELDRIQEEQSKE